jgi:trehalose 6-phosphate phosphatase
VQAADSQAPDVAELVLPLRQNPGAAAVLCDVDGTLAPIVERAEDAAVPAAARAELEQLARSYAIVACISGRRASVARELVGIDGLTYIGNHGYERLAPRAPEAEPVPELAGHEGDAAGLIASLDAAELDARGLRIEDKGPIRALHWRGAPDETAAARRADEIAADAQERGLLVHWGRMVLEIRPPVEIDKGMAVTSVLAGTDVRAAIYGGDDRTDLDAFRSLRELRDAGGLEVTVCVGVASAEGPEELAREADALVDGTDGFLDVLRSLRPAG